MKKDIICYPVKEEIKHYRIGMFSQMNRLSIKTLRYYDEIGLLSPEYVDEITGYRYYTSSQLPQLHKILSLREMNLSIAEIKQILLGTSEEKLLIQKKNTLLKEMAEINRKIACIESYLSGDFLKSDYHIITKSLPKVTVAAMTVHLNGYEDLFYKMPDMGAEMEKMECECAVPEYCFTIYYDQEYRDTNIHAKICEAITKPFETNERLECQILEPVELAVCALHKGPYATLPKTYNAIVQFIEENGYEIVGYQRESYIDGIWNKDNEDDWLTEIQFPVKKHENT